MAIDLATGFNIGSKDAIDERQVLTLEQMKNLDESIYPDKYFAICKDDSMLYVYNVNNPVDAETGKFRKVSSNESVDPSIFQKINDDTLITEDKTIAGAINELKTGIDNTINNVLDGHSFKFLIQAEYNKLTDEEKNNPLIVYYITDKADEGLTENQLQQLDTAYKHSQSTHVQQSDIPTKISELRNDSGYITSDDISDVVVDEMTVIELNNFLDTLEINAVGYVPPTTP